MEGVAGMKGKQTVRDMVLSMAAIGVVVAGVYVFIPHDDSLDPLGESKDYTVELTTARRAAPYPVAAPEGLPTSWKATSVRYDGASENGTHWHLGYLDSDRQYIAVEQGDGKASKFIAEVSHGARETDRTERIGGSAWQRYEGAKYDALVLRSDTSTTVVTGTASWDRLTRMAEALKTG
ncbi:DUF4245 domain-containing protein [Streptomyces sp. GC420]|uniref:DUF4245 domain-containing protein n=1 Tax=Streptomyces sp. GC420 TaxID=2697568 RepID=UPI001414DC64|nr:DUF4245 domain-containing protein [Streptomyces sp. GC420]NBM20979.1 DUF4245 family protein [Streptomyces sp. GC420]